MNGLDRLGGKSILVVEDEFLLADDLSRALVEGGAQVIGPAPSAQAAEQLLQSAGPIDAAVLDINLRNVMSYPIAKLLQDRATPFLFTTGYDQGLIPEQFRSAPVVLKPYDRRGVLDELLKLL